MDENNKGPLISVSTHLSGAGVSPAFPIIKANRGWVDFGAGNDFPQMLININSKSPVNSAIIGSTVTYICGKGVKDSGESIEGFVGKPNPGETWDDFIECVAIDYRTFGGFYFQVVKNKDSKTVSLFSQDFSAVRIGDRDEFGAPVQFRIANDWRKTGGKNKPIVVEVWPGIKDAEDGKAYIFYHYDYSPGLQAYCVPSYYAALEYARADGALAQFYNNSIETGFTPSVVVEMPSNPSPEKKAVFQSEMDTAFNVAKGGTSVVVLWGENGEVKPKITPFNASANADIYNNIEGIIFQKIISAHRLSSPTLAGVSGSGNLSGNAAEIIDAYVLYNYTVVEKARRRILDSINIFTALNKTGKLTIEELDVLPKIRETSDPEAIISTGDNAAVEEAPATKTVETLQRPNPIKKLFKSLTKWK